MVRPKRIGRPPNPEGVWPEVATTLHPEVAKTIDDLADLHGLNRGRIIRNIIHTWFLENPGHLTADGHLRKPFLAALERSKAQDHEEVK